MEFVYVANVILFVVLCTVDKSEATCSDPGAPVNGFVSGLDTFETGSKVQFSCEDDYELVGSPVSVCKDDKWSFPLPQCIPNCPVLSAPDNGEVIGESSKFGMVAKFFCDEGFSLVGASMVTCKGGDWSHPMPTCLANCNDPGFPENSERFTEGFEHGDCVKFVCDPGYDMIGSDTVTCRNGLWNHYAPLCVNDM